VLQRNIEVRQNFAFCHQRDHIVNVKRPGSADRQLARIKQWREICPDLTLRSTFIVGFPGVFRHLIRQLIGGGAFNRAVLEAADAVETRLFQEAEEVKEERWNRFMQLQQQISAERLQEKVGREILVHLFRHLIRQLIGGGAFNRAVLEAADAVETRLFQDMQLQQQISAERLQEKVGREILVLVDEVDEEGAIGRIRRRARLSPAPRHPA
jgi:tRNA A37 methylthiotransferase MiaB